MLGTSEDPARVRPSTELPLVWFIGTNHQERPLLVLVLFRSLTVQKLSHHRLEL